jgi:hypothetical protein
MSYCLGTKMPADSLTKPLDKLLHAKFLTLINMVKVPVTVYEERTLRVPRVLSWCSSLTSMSTFYSYQHQRYVI